MKKEPCVLYPMRRSIIENNILENEIENKIETTEEIIASDDEKVFEPSESELDNLIAELSAEMHNEEPTKEDLTVAEIPEIEPPIEESPTQVTSEEDTNFFKSIKWQRTWNKIATALIITIIAIPVAILAYILIKFLT